MREKGLVQSMVWKKGQETKDQPWQGTCQGVISASVMKYVFWVLFV